MTFSQAADTLISHYNSSGDRNVKEVTGKLKAVRAHFDHYRLCSIDEDGLDKYVAKRQAAGLSNGTINRELSLLGTTLRLTEEQRS